jgi:predicted transcriptional regulator
MKTTPEWLDAAKAKHGLSDYALAPKLGITRSQMSRYRNGADFLSDDAAIKMADLLGMDSPAEIIASAHAERAKSEDVRAFWAAWAEKLGGVAATILVTAGMGGGLMAPPDAQAAGRSQIPSNSSAGEYTSY